MFTSNLIVFRKDFLQANSWPQRKDGVPLDLLDNLSQNELKIAEVEMISSLSLHDTWPIIGLGHIKSKEAIPKLYGLLGRSTRGVSVIIAWSIFQISHDKKMIDIVLEEMPKIISQYELIDILYMLPSFRDDKVNALLNSYRSHKEYLVAYNAARALGLSTDAVVEEFRRKKTGPG